VTYRNPALLAKIVTTLDAITRGRAILGIGAAWYDVEHEGMGFDFPSAKERLDRLEEALRICRAMFTEEAPSYEGRYYRLTDVRNVPRPIQSGGPPILVGGGGERRTLRLAAQYGDMCNFFGDLDTVRHKVKVLRDHCADVGRDPADVTVTRLATLALTDSSEATTQTREMIEAAAGRERLATFNIGEEKEVLDQVAELADAGVEYFIFNIPLGDTESVRRAGELLTQNFGG
jgi:alkanesulfonate monooxygenase SsuD/methylene tetrahydromethanopterin reductase-like flavin-dependent oxidoreductase (luciferase family)